MSELTEVPLHSVHILRGKDVITTTVPKHEVRVLQAVHGPERVTDQGETEDTIALDLNLETEQDRLRRTYRRTNQPDAVDIAYPNGNGLESFGFTSGGGSAFKQPQSAVKKHAKKKGK